ncbi:MAG: hypothetical protein ING06_18100 [Roseomonas sp.]|nr:hypothetical protein [Roseomonas sp.]
MNAKPAYDLHHLSPNLYEPVTFIDRGVNVPFTTPILLGARARPQEDGNGLEVLIPNPSGGEGVYILPWASIPEICAPTLHDRRLWGLLRDEPILSPGIVRNAAETASMEGHAGRTAILAVNEARQSREDRAKRINFGFLLRLIKQMEGKAAGLPSPELDDPRQIALRGQRAVLACAQRLRMTTEAVAAALEELARAFNGLGMPQDNNLAPSRQMIAELQTLAASIESWRSNLPAHVASGSSTLVEKSLQLTLDCAYIAAEQLDSLMGDTFGTIHAWQQDRQEILHELTRLDWLLDGWGTLLGIWNAAEPSDKNAAIMEMAVLAPILPKEVIGWLGFQPDMAQERRKVRIVNQFEDWRSGCVIDMIARNENLCFSSGQTRGKPIIGKKSNILRPGMGVTTKTTKLSGEKAKDIGGKNEQRARNPLAETRHFVHALASASDMALAKVIEILDRLPDRSEADRLLDAARPRLKQIRPSRSLQFTRLLFLPLDGAISDNRDWQRDDTRLPRCALPPIAEALRMAMGQEAQRIEASFQGKFFHDIADVDRAGRPLWAAAARLASDLTPGPRWERTGLRPDDFAPLVELAAGVWRHAGPIWAAVQLAGWGPPDDAVRAALAPMADEVSPAFTMALATLMLKATSPGQVAREAATLSDKAASIADTAVDEWLERARVQLPSEDLIAAASFAEAFGRAFQDLENAPTTRNPRRGARLVQLRQEAEVTCRLAYEDGLETHILRQLPSLSAAATPELILAVERQARALRRIESIGRRYGLDHGYDGAAQRIAAALEAARRALEPGGMTRLDLARLAEILLGPEAALAYLG